MKFDNIESFLTGEDFSEGILLKLTQNPLYSRVDTLLNIVRGQNVIHIGCCDHIPLIESKIADGTWLQGILDKECNRVLGIDINKEAVDFVNIKSYSKQPAICCDITRDRIASYMDISGYEWAILGEILEHVDNPVQFMYDLQKNLLDNGFKGKIIITVPNAFSFQKGKYLFGYETVNTDHRYWFSPYTLAKVITQSGLYPEELLFTDYENGNNGQFGITRKLSRLICKIRGGRPLSLFSHRSRQLLMICSYRSYDE